MQRDFYLEWLKKWFGKKVQLPLDAIHLNFFDEGWLDSLKTLELIVEIETVLKIPLNDLTLSDPRFSSILGLSEILFELQDIKLLPTIDERNPKKSNQ